MRSHARLGVVFSRSLRMFSAHWWPTAKVSFFLYLRGMLVVLGKSKRFGAAAISSFANAV
jgi:hypothetical protein